ncbi:MAG: cobalamin B12-binding domain-containing protein [Nitrospirae bacterium]|nr:cobalamin B12-binding domain-containing protein [Nitrospirota bacterium]
MLDRVIREYSEAIFDTDRERALRIVHEAVDRGMSPEDIVFRVVLPAMEGMIRSISENFDSNLAQHFMTAQIASEVADEMIPKFTVSPSVAGHVVIGTAQGDMHSLGKRIVIGCLKARMIEVTDLGVNVTPERFVDEAVARNAEVIAISAMMVHTAKGDNGCLRVRQILKERGLEDTIRIVVGGAPFHFAHDLYKAVLADAWAEDGVTAGRVIEDCIREVGK